MNDIDKETEGQITKFAHTTKLYRAIRSEQDADALQKDTNQIEQWSSKWQMSFNASKYKTMHYGYGNSNRIYKINGKEIESFSQESDLGILIQEDLDWDTHVA